MVKTVLRVADTASLRVADTLRDNCSEFLKHGIVPTRDRAFVDNTPKPILPVMDDKTQLHIQPTDAVRRHPHDEHAQNIADVCSMPA